MVCVLCMCGMCCVACIMFDVVVHGVMYIGYVRLHDVYMQCMVCAIGVWLYG